MADQYGIRVAKPGYDVKTAGYNKLLFTSEFPLLKIHDQNGGRLLLDVDGFGASGSVTIHHGLGYRPIYFVRANLIAQFSSSATPGLAQLPYSTYAGLGQFIHEKVYPTEQDLIIRIDAPNTGVPYVDYDYIIFEDPIFDPDA